VRAVHRVPDLGRARQRYRLVVGVQVVGVVVIAGLVMLFARWVSKPYRRLVQAAGEAGLPGDRGGGVADPEHLAAAFRAVVAKLREQDDAMGSVERRGGLSDLVRFASRGAREMSSGVLVVDRQGSVASMNPAAAALLGHDRVGSRGRPIRGVGDRVSGLATRVHTCLRSGVSISREVLAVEEGAGRVGHLGVSISPTVGRDDEIAGALVLMTDLTEIRQLQEQARLRESMASAGRLSAGIAHEFRNALGTILGYAKMLSKENASEVRGPAERIVREVDAVRATVDEFLLYARPPQPEREPVDVREILEDCAASVGPAVEIEITGEFGEVLGDETLVRRAFSNLVHNAADTAEDAERKVHLRITGRVVADGRALRLDVEDDGPGIPPEARERIFEPFFTTRSRGTGLGLALVQRTLVDLGGSIEAGQSSLGGAIFRIRVPRVVREAQRRQA
jgi:PAS domain S-box-containing protein